MVDLNKNKEEIKTFLKASINRFQMEKKEFNSIGIYCCAWSAWISTNFNKSLIDTDYSCLDFDVVEFDLMDMPEWENEYETDSPKFKLKDAIKTHNHDLGDENLNQLIFEFLKPIVAELKQNYNSEFLLQMLDSNLREKI